KTAFEGRHANITFIMSMQNVTKVPKEIRQNTMILIFTAGAAVNLFFGNAASGETHNKKTALAKSTKVFKESGTKHGKLV
ncbi:hypothetical protein DF186_24220, partial [Enterococcus hirae]